MLRDSSSIDSQDPQSNAICEDLCDDFIRTGTDFLLELGVCEAFYSEMTAEDFTRLVSRHLGQKQRRHRSSRASSTQESQANLGQLVPTDAKSPTPKPEPVEEVIERRSSAKLSPERDQVVPNGSRAGGQQLSSICAPSTHPQPIQSPVGNFHQSTPRKWISSASLPKSPPPALDQIIREEQERLTAERLMKAERVRTYSNQPKTTNSSSSAVTSTSRNWTSPTIQVNPNCVRQSSASTRGPTSLREIQESQKLPSAPECPSKAIHLVEVEERAIVELGQYYENIFEDGTAFFTTRRELGGDGTSKGHETDFSVSKWRRDV